jgi:hypothetical protein
MMDDLGGSDVDGSPLSDLSSLPASPQPANSTLPEGNEETLSNSDTEEHAPLSLGDMHLSVRPTAMAVIPPDMSNVLESSANCHQGVSKIDAEPAEPSTIPKKRQREIIDYILVPSLPQPVQLPITQTPRTRKSQAKGTTRRKEKNGNQRVEVEQVRLGFL